MKGRKGQVDVESNHDKEASPPGASDMSANATVLATPPLYVLTLSLFIKDCKQLRNGMCTSS